MKKIIIYGCMVLMGIISGCKKDFLDVKPKKSLLVPTTLADFQALMDNSSIMNIMPALNVISADELYTTPAGLSAYANASERNSYTWADDIFEGATSTDWNRPYQQIFYANVVLDGLAAVNRDASNSSQYDQIKGTALFFRGMAYFNLAQEFTVPYNKSTAGQEMGLPVHTSSDVNILPGRGTLQETYDQILSDLTQADVLLPATVAYKSRPSKTADEGLLARVYQITQDYVNAGVYADKYLKVNSKLIDFNTLSTTSNAPFPNPLPSANDEVIFYSTFVPYTFISSASTLVDTTLYKSYSNSDLRKSIYFRNRGNNIFTGFKGYRGITTNEMYFIRAESFARAGSTNLAMADLNTVLLNRWLKGTYVSLSAGTPDTALGLILSERRKDLVFSGLRWMDLRRLNQDSRFTVTMTRNFNGKVYQLKPNDLKYTLPIPDDEIRGSGIPQNRR